MQYLECLVTSIEINSGNLGRKGFYSWTLVGHRIPRKVGKPVLEDRNAAQKHTVKLVLHILPKYHSHLA